jgi:hypothetical protein
LSRTGVSRTGVSRTGVSRTGASRTGAGGEQEQEGAESGAHAPASYLRGDR